VTIDIGFKCDDGLLLATDTQYSKGDFKSDGPKIFPTVMPADRADLAVVIAGAGTVPLMKRAQEFLRTALLGLASPSSNSVRALVEETLLAFYKKFVYPRNDEADFDLIFAVWTESDGFEIFTSNQNALNPLLGSHASVGEGTYVSDYALATVFDVKMSAENTRYLAAICVKAAKDHVASCGGDTVITTMTHDEDGTLRIRREPRNNVLEFEEDTQEIRDGMKYILQVLDTDQFPDDSIVSELASGMIADAAIRFRKKQKERREKARQHQERQRNRRLGK
jgi:hypothetical protein